jgi:hypothetical protein
MACPQSSTAWTAPAIIEMEHGFGNLLVKPPRMTDYKGQYFLGERIYFLY